MYSRLPAFVLGFHGCDISTHEKVLKGGEELNYSTNTYDWLGHGIYFWEQSPQRALEYATLLMHHPERSKTKIETPSVVGAIIDLGNCLNLLDSLCISVVKTAYEAYLSVTPHEEIPQNKGGNDLLKRYLDCAVIQFLHGTTNNKYETVRGLFREGDPLYTNAGFYEKTHIQICVKNASCIKGYFDPRL